MALYSSVLAWRIPWTEEPGGLQSRGLQRVRHNTTTAQRGKHHEELRDFGRDFCFLCFLLN